MGVAKNKKLNTIIKITASCSFFIALAVFLLLPVGVSAIEGSGGLEYVSDAGLTVGTDDIRVIVLKVLRIIFGVLGIVFLILIVYGGFIYMTSAGQPDKVEKAKSIIRNAVIGLIIIITAFSIVHFLIKKFYEIFGVIEPLRPDIVTVFGGGALGDGPIRSVYPAPNQQGVPRNTLIMITFKQPVQPCSIAVDTDGDGTCADSDLSDLDYLRADTVPIKIFRDGDDPETQHLPANEISVYTADNLTFVLDPVGLLGQPDEWIWYGTKVTDSVKHMSGDSIFKDYYLSSYSWKYQVSNIVDLTPPQVQSEFPWQGDWPRNVIIRANFTEAMNAVSVSGTTETVDDAGDADSDGIFEEIVTDTFDEVTVFNDTDKRFIPGKFTISNQYKTIEFFPEAECEGVEENSCGDPVYCLPGNKKIIITVKPAPLDVCPETPGNPTKGATDAAANSLDGDKDNESEGCDLSQAGVGDTECNTGDTCSGNDMYRWIFNTTNEIDLTPPEIDEVMHVQNGLKEAYSQASGQSLTARPADVSLIEPIRMTFDKMMLSSYLKPDGKYGDGREYIYLLNPLDPVGYYISNSTGDGCTRDCLYEGSRAAGATCGNNTVFNCTVATDCDASRGETCNVTSGQCVEYGEDCDDGNRINGDGCSNDCLHEGNAVCGNGKVERGEDCDDGNENNGDGCSSICIREGNIDICANPLSDTFCCGNGIIEAGEECDDGKQCGAGGDPCLTTVDCADCNTYDGGGCSSICINEGSAAVGADCGDGKITWREQEGGEECDDLNNNDGDGCSSDCLHEGALCGNDVVDEIYEECEPASNPIGCAWNCLLKGNPVNGEEASQCGNGGAPEPLVGEECDDGQAGLSYQMTKVYIDHDEFAEEATYGVKVGSGVKDAFQNCFFPGAGPDCVDTADWDGTEPYPDCRLPN